MIEEYILDLEDIVENVDFESIPKDELIGYLTLCLEENIAYRYHIIELSTAAQKMYEEILQMKKQLQKKGYHFPEPILN